MATPGNALQQHILNGEDLAPMHQPHHQPSGDGLDPTDHLLATLQARLARIATATLWSNRSAEVIAELRTDLGGAIDEIDTLRDEVAMWRRMAARHVGVDPDNMPPDHYVNAVHTPQYELYRPVSVEIDGQPWTVGLKRDRRTDLDLLQVMRGWGQLVTSVREARASLAGGA